MGLSLCHTTVHTIQVFDKKIAALLEDCTSLEGAAQTVTNFLFEEYEDSILLIRFFAIIPFGKLPGSIQKAAYRFTQEDVVLSLIQDDTPVLTLLGLRGGVDIQNVKCQFGIPLVSPECMRSIPMVSDVLYELGFRLPYSSINETSSMNGLSDIFYLTDAQHATDTDGRRFISGADRVAISLSDVLSKIETIFAIGGAYLHDPFIALMIFSRKSLERRTAELFMPLANTFEMSTRSLIAQGKLFSS